MPMKLSVTYNAEREELNSHVVKRDLQLLLKHPKAGGQSLGDRLE